MAVLGFALYSLAWFGCFNYLLRENKYRRIISSGATIIFAYAIPMFIADVSFDSGFDDPFLIVWTMLPFVIFIVILLIRKIKKS